MIRDLLFGTLLFALTAYAGHVLFGDIEGVAIWRILWLAGTGGWLGGYRARMHREETAWLNRHQEPPSALDAGALEVTYADGSSIAVRDTRETLGRWQHGGRHAPIWLRSPRP